MQPDAITTAVPAARTEAPLRAPEVVFAPGEPGGTLAVDPAFAEVFARAGLTTASAFLTLPGEVVTGHPDRNVTRVELPGAGVFYLKRQHVVGWREKWRNRRAGFGWVSRCEREANLLQQLRTAGLPAPRWAAFGAHRNRAFVLLEEVAGAVELRRVLSDGALSLARRRELAANIGRAVAAVHGAGFTTPDLTAKHVLVNCESLAVTFLDWQSAVRRAAVGEADRADALGALHASLAAALASRAERARVFVALTSPLRGEVAGTASVPAGGGETNSSTSDVTPLPAIAISSASYDSPPPAGTEGGSGDLPPRGASGGLQAPHTPRGGQEQGRAADCSDLRGGQRQRRAERAALLPLIRRAAEHHAERRSIRDQLQPLPPTDPHRLIWLAGEAVCAVPEAAVAWPKPAIGPPFYGFGPQGAAPVRFAGREAVLVRGSTAAPLGRLRAWLRATRWRSPGVTTGRVLFHLERYGVPAPRLLAFGQRFVSLTGAEWFALYEAPRGVLLRRWRRLRCATEQRKMFDAVAECLRKLHDAGCVLADARAAFAVSAGGEVSIADPFAVRLVRRVTEEARRRDRRAMARLLGVE